MWVRVSRNASAREESCRTRGLAATSARCALARRMMAGNVSAELVAERGDVDHVDGERVVLQVALVQQGVGAPEGKDGRIAVVRGDEHRRARGRPAVAQRPPRRDALAHEMRQHSLGTLVPAELDERGHVEAQPRHGDGGVHGPAAHVVRDLHRLRLAALLQQQEGAVGVEHGHALDAIVGDDRDGIEHGAADGQGFHADLPLPAHGPPLPAHLQPRHSLRQRGERAGDEGQRQPPTWECAAAPHPNPLPASGERGSRRHAEML